MRYDTRYLLLSGLLFAVLTSIPLLSLGRGRAGVASGVVILSPHPDDAVLCCAGVIQQAVADGKPVRIITVTDGDAHLAAAAIWFQLPPARVNHAMMRRFGAIRRREDVRALTSLGVSPRHISFLGYPDGFLDETYDATSPFVSPSTGRRAPQTGQSGYTGASLVADLTRLLTQFSPMVLYLPDPLDGGLDHRVVNAAARDALRAASLTVSAYRYVIHPPTDPAFFLRPAPVEFPLTETQRMRKEYAVHFYASQINTDEAYLRSFIGDREHFYP